MAVGRGPDEIHFRTKLSLSSYFLQFIICIKNYFHINYFHINYFCIISKGASGYGQAADKEPVLR